MSKSQSLAVVKVWGGVRQAFPKLEACPAAQKGAPESKASDPGLAET